MTSISRLDVIILGTAGFATIAMAVVPSGVPTPQPVPHAVSQTNGIAIDGYDPVSYFADGEPLQGTPHFEKEYQGAVYRFASQENLEAFAAAPSAYLPQLGGYSVFAMAKGKHYGADPTAFDIIDGKLYLSRNKKVRDLWQANPAGFLGQAEENWRARQAP